ncbi:hypothetical protein ILUMI_09430 [Ignelater luminosus]|uniref:Uncharacterized protein n=1 Tax=Ignelater luminosus TaxID=2038154 RepID=A0A8K0D493_IGNLU|nr:hypothetical protein ILUMI_09430 [Ignelater luminosus]
MFSRLIMMKSKYTFYICCIISISIAAEAGMVKIQSVNEKNLIPSERHKRDLSVYQEESNVRQRQTFLSLPSSIFNYIFNLIKNSITSGAQLIIKSVRDVVLSLFNTVMIGLAQFIKQSEPELMLSSILAHTLNLTIKRALEFLAYIKGTVKYFFDMFLSGEQ